MAKPSLPISSVNHISLLCSSVEISAAFYEDVLGFLPVKRPGSFDFDGAWLFNYGMGIHLIRAPNPSLLPKKREIDPKDNHMSFQEGRPHTSLLGVVESRGRHLSSGIEAHDVELYHGNRRQRGALVDIHFQEWHFHYTSHQMHKMARCSPQMVQC